MKKILESKAVINKVLSGTQRKTPTIIHKRFPIEGIRRFYIRKIKFVQHGFSSNITEIIDMFPSIDYIHPFFGNLLNLMFQRQHYKLSLSKLSKSKRVIDIISRNFVKLVKNGSSLYTCKQLKKEAIGRICTIIQKLSKSLIFLEKVRKHLENLPELDPHRKSVILCGSTKSGKSSCLNKTTRANIKVGDSSKNNNFILLGHMPTNFSRLQILDISLLFDPTDLIKNSLFIQLYNTFFNLDCIISHFFDISGCFSIPFSNQIEFFKKLNNFNSKIGKFLVLSKADLGWEKLLDKTQKAGINLFLKKTNYCGGVLKISSHDEIGLYSLKRIMCSLTFNRTNWVENNGSKKKIKFSRSSFMKYNQKNDKMEDKKFFQDINRNLSIDKTSFVYSSSFNSNASVLNFFSKTKIVLDDTILKLKEINPLICSNNEREQKNREIKTEIFFSNTKIKNFKEINKHYENCLFTKNNSINLSLVVFGNEKTHPLLI